mgnify:CR=1 FL=1
MALRKLLIRLSRSSKLWNSLKATNPDLFADYCYGNHGECGKEYVGEEDRYGSEGWNLVAKMLNFGSEIALKLIKKRENMGRSNEFKMPLDVYVDRYDHLFLNQISPLVDELYFYLVQLAYRFFLYTTGREPPIEVLQDLVMKIGQMLQQEVQSYMRKT